MIISPETIAATQTRLAAIHARAGHKVDQPLESMPCNHDAQGIEPAETKFQKGQERDLHEKFEGWCRINNIFTIHSRMDKRTTTDCGVADFICMLNAHCVAVEWKAHKNPEAHLSPEQRCWRDDWIDSGGEYLCTNDLAAAILFAKEKLKL